MKKIIVSFSLFCLFSFVVNAQSWIRINQLGYLPKSTKVAVWVAKEQTTINTFDLMDAKTNKKVWSSKKVENKGAYGPFTATCRLDFSDFEIPGEYYLQADTTLSPTFRVGPDVYDHTADFLLKYMRQQRCGFNPFFNDSCHLDDGFIVYHPTKSGQHLDVTGGWHDATDYLQYTATSANAVFQLLFAYRENPAAFGDAYQANGLPGANGIPDVLDEAKWGMDWLLKMNPSDTEYYNQIADDRDHAGFRLPTLDKVVYDSAQHGRPVYFCTGEPQGLVKYKNRATGIASTAGKYASAYAIGAAVLAEHFPEYAPALASRAEQAFTFGQQHPGACQTAPGGAPYFYEEDNWVDDMELAAAELYRLTGDASYLAEAQKYARQEPITPWMGADTARHYQWYPFFNAGHYEAAAGKSPEKSEFIAYYAKGLELIQKRGQDNAFLMGIPFIWCSNNLVAACLSQSRLYRKLSGDPAFEPMEAALRDWLFGCNPWGTSMIVGLPEEGDTPIDPHSSLTHLYNYKIDGGLIDGPVYGTIFNRLKGLVLFYKDEYAPFQSDLVVYHDDVGDYSTNEPTMDGTACLVYYLAAMEAESAAQGYEKPKVLFDKTGAIIRGDTSQKKIALVFTGDEFADGGQVILRTLERHNIKASFFLTGNFYRNPKFIPLIKKLRDAGHYLGPHSDRHLLYCDWTPERNLLVDQDSFSRDLEINYAVMSKFNITKADASYFLPPYEWNNEAITFWTQQMDLTLINYTPGTLSHADYTTPDDNNYRSSEEIYNSILDYEHKNGLNGFILLSHIGTDARRTDKFYHKLDVLIQVLKQKDYEFGRIGE
ncbi:MAG: hypothetical protein DHS20C18_46650 [Saprospiraceae bacterium]|nr:MAG: hypothetical protein DHS20C18_46650 [Saprospiraceae bacterium]